MALETDTDKRPKCIAYIDGYNWYHAIFKHYPGWKWLNIHAFFQALRPRENVVLVKLFSAMQNEMEARSRQERYFNALRTISRTQLILGTFQEREVTCRSDCKKVYLVQEEKKTDVNMAVEMMSDAVFGKCDHMCIATADSDIQPAVEWVAKHHPGVRLTVYIPALRNEQNDRRTDYYRTKGLKIDCVFLPLQGIQENQLQGCVKLADGKFAVRPHSWESSVAATS